jgi:HCOMODA/2-hydroxy-3-carboxy-muconic semialdehyde decarboxylase
VIAKDSTLLVELVDANLILFHQKIVDGLGHISVRDPDDPALFWMSREIAPGLVTADDLLQYRVSDGEPVNDGGRRSYFERFIHSEILKVRPDVNSVAHSHAEEAILFGATGIELHAFAHVHAFLWDVRNFEIRGLPANPKGNLLVNSTALGAALAKTLGDGRVALMRGHGMVAVGGTIREAVHRSIYTIQNARLQRDAMLLGKPITFLDRDEMELNTLNFGRGNYARSWAIWVKEAREAAGREPDLTPYG